MLKYNHSRTYRQNIGQDDDRLPDVRLVHINRFEEVDSAEKIAHVLKEHGRKLLIDCEKDSHYLLGF